MLAGIPLSTWLSGEDAYSLKVIISTGDAQKKEITLPFGIQKKQFVSERIQLDTRNTGSRKDTSPERHAQYVDGSTTSLCPVCDFPFGASSSQSKVKQIEIVASHALVKEIDIVASFGLIRSGRYEEVQADIAACVKAAHSCKKELKVIFETDVLNEEQIRSVCCICVDKC